MKTGSRHFTRTAAIVLTSLLVTLINPFGLSIYREVLRHAQVPMSHLIVEWLPPFYWQSVFIILAGAVTGLLILIFGQRKIFRLLVLILGTGLALQSRRSLPLFSLALIYALFEEKLAITWNYFFQRVFNGQLLAFILLPIFFLSLKNNLTKGLTFNEKSYCHEALVVMPCGAVNFLSNQKVGPVFNAYEWGGFLEWRLPNFKFFVDGRMPSWPNENETNLPPNWRGKSPYTVYLDITQTADGWEEILNNYQIKYLLLVPGSPLDHLLSSDSPRRNFRPVFRDDVSIVYQRI